MSAKKLLDRAGAWLSDRGMGLRIPTALGALFALTVGSAGCFVDQPGTGPVDNNTGAATATGGSGNGGDGGSGAGTQGPCVPAEGAPAKVALHLMLDRSRRLSIGDRWSALTTGIEGFLKAPSPAAEVAASVYPERDPAAPLTCGSDGECGVFGACEEKTCYGNVFFCESDNDCFNDECVPIGVCSGDLGLPCGVLDVPCADGLGTCVVPSSGGVCALPEDCAAADYASPLVAFTGVPGGAADLTAALKQQIPSGARATRAALEGAVSYVQKWSATHPTEQGAIVLFVAGTPMTCGSDVEVANVAKKALEGSPTIRTFTMWLTSNQTEGMDFANLVASAGGTGSLYFIDENNISATMSEGLTDIAARMEPCSYVVPEVPSDGHVTWTMTPSGSGSAAVILPQMAGFSACGSDDGWYFGEASAEDHTVKVMACPRTCAALATATDVHVDLICDPP